MPGVEALVRERVLVEHRDLVARGQRRARDRGRRRGRRRRSGRDIGADSTERVVARRRGIVAAVAAAASAATARARRSSGRRGEDHLAGRLGDHVLRRRPPRSCRAGRRGRRAARRRGSATAPRRRARSPRTPRRRASSTIAWPARRARTVAVATSTPSYSSPTALARASAARACLSCASGSARVDRQRHRDLEDPQRLDRRALVLVERRRRPPRRPGGRPSGRCRRRAACPMSGTRIDPYSASCALAAQRRARARARARSSGLPCVRAVDDVEREADGHPAEPDVARALVGDDDADPGGAR